MRKIWGYRVAAAVAAGLLAAGVLLPAQRAAAAEWQTYLAENFDSPETMFYAGQAGEAFYSVEDGRYIIDGLNTESDSLSALTDGMYYYYAEASCEMLQSTAGDLAFCGLVFHYNKKTQGKLSYYVFYVYGDGYYGAKRVIGDQVEIVLPLTRTTELVGGRPNTLGVDAQGTRFDLYINGKYVDGFTDVRIDGGGFGFYISKHSKAAFDDFTVKVEQRGGMQPAAEPNAVENGVAPEEGPNSASGESGPKYRFPDIPKNPNRPTYPWEVGVDKSRKGKARRKAEEQEQQQEEQPSGGGGEESAGPEAQPEEAPQEPPETKSSGIPSEHGKLAPGEQSKQDESGKGKEPPKKVDHLKKPKKAKHAKPPEEEAAPPPADDSSGGGSSDESQGTETESQPSEAATDVALIPAPPEPPAPEVASPGNQPGELQLPQGEELVIGEPPAEEKAVRPPVPAPKETAAAAVPEPAVEPEPKTESPVTAPEPEPPAAAPEPELPAAAPEPPAPPAETAPPEAEQGPELPPAAQPETVPGLIKWPTEQQPTAPDAPKEPGGTTAQASRNNALRGMRSSGDDWADPNADSEVVAEHKPPKRPLPADKLPADSKPADEAPAETAEVAAVPETEQPAETPAEEQPAEPESALSLFPEQQPVDEGPGATAPSDDSLPVGERQGDRISFEQPPTEAPELPVAGNPPEELTTPPADVENAAREAPAAEPASAIEAPADELTVIQDDFTQPRWPVAESPASVYRYFGAAYEINNLNAETMAISFQEGALADLEIGIDAEYLDGQSYVGYGVAGRFTVTDGSVSYYGLFVSQSGEFLLLKVLNGTEFVLQDWTASSLLSPSKPSRLKLELIGGTIRAFINNELVASVQDGDLTSGGYALLVGPGCSARFDNLLLRGITQEAKQAMSAAGL